jgi:hypothetical protein
MVHALGGEVAHPCRRRIIADPYRRLKVDPSQILARAEPGGSEGVERGGLGGDPPAASGRADVDQADHQGDGAAPRTPSSEPWRPRGRRATSGWLVGRSWARPSHTSGSCCERDRRCRPRWSPSGSAGPLADGAQGSGAGAAAGLPVTLPSVLGHLQVWPPCVPRPLRTAVTRDAWQRDIQRYRPYTQRERNAVSEGLPGRRGRGALG